MTAKKTKRELFDYDSLQLGMRDSRYWGIWISGNKVKVDTKRLAKMTKGWRLDIPDAVLSNVRSTVYLVPKKRSRYDYKTNRILDSFDEMIERWKGEFIPLIDRLMTPEEVEQGHFLSKIAMTADSDDYDEIRMDAQMVGFKRIRSYNVGRYILLAGFIGMLSFEIDRLLILAFQLSGIDCSKFSRQKMKNELFLGKVAEGYRHPFDLEGWGADEKLHALNNFLKHSNVSSLDALEKVWPEVVVNREGYLNGMLGLGFVRLDLNDIEKLIVDIRHFFVEYCKEYFKEDPDEAKWNHDDYFRGLFSEILCSVDPSPW